MQAQDRLDSPAAGRATRPLGRPPVLRFLGLFIGMLAVALALAAVSPPDDRTERGASATQGLRGVPESATREAH